MPVVPQHGSVCLGLQGSLRFIAVGPPCSVNQQGLPLEACDSSSSLDGPEKRDHIFVSHAPGLGDGNSRPHSLTLFYYHHHRHHHRHGHQLWDYIELI